MDEEYLKTDYESEIEKLDNDYKLKIKEKKIYKRYIRFNKKFNRRI